MAESRESHELSRMGLGGHPRGHPRGSRNLDLDEAKQRRKWGCSSATCWAKPLGLNGGNNGISPVMIGISDGFHDQNGHWFLH